MSKLNVQLRGPLVEIRCFVTYDKLGSGSHAKPVLVCLLIFCDKFDQMSLQSSRTCVRLHGENFAIMEAIARAGLRPMQPMQLHWAPRHAVWAGCSFLPDTARTREL